MQSPVQITFRGFPLSDAVEANIREKAAWLEGYYPNIISCRVSVEAHHHHHHQGNLYHVRIVLGVPGKELVVSREQHDKHAHEDVYVGIRDAFNAARRQVEDFARRRRGKTKQHEVPAHGKVTSIMPDAGFGIIETSDGHEVQFDKNSVLDNNFNDLDVGSEVRFVEQQSEEGARASTVRVVGKHHIVADG